MEKTRQLENIAANLDDISLTLEEIKETAAEGGRTSAKALDRIEDDVTRAADAIDEAVDSKTSSRRFGMFLSLTEVQRIASEVAAEENPDLQVAVTSSQGESAYIELILTLTGCSVEPAARSSVSIGTCRARNSASRFRTNCAGTLWSIARVASD